MPSSTEWRISIATQGAAQKLPYPASTFDAAYMISTLGEIPNSATVLSELRRVMKPTGRLVIAEVIVDPDYVSLADLEKRVKTAGFLLERTSGPKFSYFALFRPIDVRARHLHAMYHHEEATKSHLEHHGKN
jgi:ubiquinone/menaquinone biosynthesis C-methylase UbiE